MLSSNVKRGALIGSTLFVVPTLPKLVAAYGFSFTLFEIGTAGDQSRESKINAIKTSLFAAGACTAYFVIPPAFKGAFVGGCTAALGPRILKAIKHLKNMK